MIGEGSPDPSDRLLKFLVDADKATAQVGKGFGKAKDKLSRHKEHPADEDPTDEESAIHIQQEPDKHHQEKYRGEKVWLSKASPAFHGPCMFQHVKKKPGMMAGCIINSTNTIIINSSLAELFSVM